MVESVCPALCSSSIFPELFLSQQSRSTDFALRLAQDLFFQTTPGFSKSQPDQSLAMHQATSVHAPLPQSSESMIHDYIARQVSRQVAERLYVAYPIVATAAAIAGFVTALVLVAIVAGIWAILRRQVPVTDIQNPPSRGLAALDQPIRVGAGRNGVKRGRMALRKDSGIAASIMPSSSLDRYSLRQR